MTEGDEMDGKVSVSSIVFMMVASSAAMITTAYIGIGLWSMREVAGFVLGIALSLLLIGQTLGRIYRRGSAGVDRALADAELDEIRARSHPAASLPAPGFERFRPAVPMVRGPSGAYPAPDVTARIYRGPNCPTERIDVYRDDSTQVIPVNGFQHDW
jgi:hypothetical protein